MSASDDIALFSAALAMPATERPAFLAKACANDTARVRLIGELLAAHDSSAGFLDTPAGPSLPLAGRAIELELAPGDRVGPYCIGEKIGEGGCGVVYLAEQAEPVRRQVALKVIKLGMDTKAVIARFEAEREALARMDHPNIARVLDAGATASGRPYFVMELVRGIAVTEYCDLHRLTTAERLRLFARVCRAVEHAHQKGVIHRDLKPSNILVTLQDGEPVPKTIDFGVAKATQGRLVDQTLFTAVGQFVGTPAYMSPEQAESGERAIDTRSDIYSLGVLLQELLTGHAPLGPQMRGLDAEQARRVIREHEAPRPSVQIVSLAPDAGLAAARARSTTPAQWIAQVRGDLDWIVTKATEKDPARRYETVSALAADVHRHLQGEPILARPPSTSYRLQKLIARHKVSFAAAAVVLVALAAAATISSRRYVEERRARERAVVAERAEADERRRAETARKVAEAAQHEAETARLAAESSRASAEAARVAAEFDRKTADRARLEAEQARSVAERSQAEATGAARELASSLYAADMYAVQNLLHQDGDVALAQRILRGHVPAAGQADLRGIEWAYAWKLAQGDAQGSWPAEQGLIRDLAVSGNGRWLVSSGRGRPGEQGQIRVWETATHRLLVAFTDAECGGFTPDSRRLLTVTRDGRVHLWRTSDWSLEAEFSIGPVDPIPNQRMELAIAPLGSLVAICTDGVYGRRQGSVRIFDWQRRIEVARLVGAGCRFVFADDGRTLASSGVQDGLIKIWDAETGALQRQLGPSGFVTGIALSPDGTRLAALIAGRRGTVRLWNLATGKLERTLASGDLDPQPGAIVFSPDGGLIASGGADRTVRVWRTGTGQPVCELSGSAAGIWALAFSVDSERLFGAGKSEQICVWSVTSSPKENETTIATLAPARPNVDDVALCFSGDGKLLAASDWERLVICDTREGKIVGRRDGHHTPLWFSPDGNELLVLNQRRRTAQLNDPIKMRAATAQTAALESLDLIRYREQTVQRSVPVVAEGRGVTAIAASADGQQVAVAWRDRSEVFLYVSDTGRAVRTIAPRAGQVATLAFSPDGRYLALGGGIFLEVWETAGATEPWRVAAHKSSITHLAYSPDGHRLATCAADGVHKFWDIAQRRETGQMGGFDRIGQAAFSPDGRTFFADTGGALRLWHVATQRDMERFPLAGVPTRFAMASDQRALAYCDEREGERRLVLVRIPALADLAAQFTSDAAVVQPAQHVRIPGALAAFAGDETIESNDDGALTNDPGDRRSSKK